VRKLWYAGAVVAGGMLLFGASPARADLIPVPGAGTAEQQADERLADLLGQSDGVTVPNPLRHSTLGDSPVGREPVVQFHAGQNSPDLRPLLPGEEPSESRRELPGGVLRPAGRLPVRNVLDRLPLFHGILPDGGLPSALQRPTARQSEVFDGGLPLLGGLAGALPANGRPRTPGGSDPDTTGLPAGGLAVLPAATTVTAAVPPAVGDQPEPAQPRPAQPRPAQPRPAQPEPDATPDDPRLHEEPIDNEGASRPFSPDGRPIAGIDQDYK
jgi:hypothetical protein